MKSNKRVKRILLILGIIFSLTAISNHNFSLVQVNNEVNLENNDKTQLKNAIDDWDEQRPRSVGNGPTCVFIGDANNDGYNDIVTANWAAGSVSILQWNAYYGDWDTQITKSVGNGPRSVFIGDANNDGYNDIVTANSGHDNVSILLWNITSVDWDTQITRQVGEDPSRVFIEDADNDGFNDIVTANTVDNEISIILWNTISSEWDPQFTISVGDAPHSVFIEDADNDGDNDIVTANYGDNNVSILLWNATTMNWDAEITKSVVYAPYSVFIEDANNDGYNDIVTANTLHNNTSILLWNATSGDWDTQITKSVGNSHYSIFIEDVNNDGYNDIVTANLLDDNVSILLWNATSGDWDTQITKSVGWSPRSIFIGDADNDGQNDIVTANGNDNEVSILLGIQRLLYIEVVKQMFSTEEFNITFSVYNETGQEIDFATIQMWWDGIDVSASVQNLGSGLYQVLLSPIFVKSGEDPILLNMTISASGYDDEYFETYLTVEPCSVSKLLCVEIIDQSFSTEEFNITFSVYNGTGQEIDFATIQLWWDGIDVSASVQNLGSGLYQVLLNPIFVKSGEDSILLNMTISASGYDDKYFETYLAVEPYLYVEIIDQSFSTEEFNITFSVYNETGQGVDLAAIQMWWNGIDVSASVVNIGDGLYQVSLSPITVVPGEDPILLNMTVSASGYNEKYFEADFAVDPDILIKGPPLAIIIVIVAAIVGGGVAIFITSIFLLKKRRKSGE